MNNTLKTQLSLVIGFITLLAIGIGILGLVGMGKANDGLKNVYEDRTVALEQISRIDRLLVQSQLAMVEAIQDSMTTTIKVKSALIEKNIAEMDQTWAIYSKSNHADVERALAEAFQRDREKMIGEGLRQTMKAMNDGDLALAGELADKVQKLSIPLRLSVEALRKIQVDQAGSEYESAKSRYAILRAVVIVAILLGGFAGAVAGYFLIKNLYRQLGGEPGYAHQIVHSIAAGDLTLEVQLKNGDSESLLYGMHRMQNTLSSTIN